MREAKHTLTAIKLHHVMSTSLSIIILSIKNGKQIKFAADKCVRKGKTRHTFVMKFTNG